MSYDNLGTTGTSSIPVSIDDCCYLTANAAITFLKPAQTGFLARTHVETINVPGLNPAMCV